MSTLQGIIKYNQHLINNQAMVIAKKDCFKNPNSHQSVDSSNKSFGSSITTTLVDLENIEILFLIHWEFCGVRCINLGILSRFCYLMGSVFGFVGQEISSKMDILEDLRGLDEGNNFGSLKQMVQYEMNSGKIKDTSYVSGSRTLLRLHRGLGK